MKTLKTIILTAALVATISQNSTAANATSFKMQISNNKVLEILVKQEEIIEENIPVYSKPKEMKTSNSTTLKNLPAYEEEIVDEELPKVKTYCFEREAEIIALVGKLAIKENEIVEDEICSKAIFAQYQKEKQFVLDNETLLKFKKHENEVIEEEIKISLIGLAK